jgi:hypothetical protein
VFASIDDHEVAHLRILLDEVFGPDAFVAQVVVIGNRGGRDYLRIATTHEYLLVYGKRPDATIRELPRTAAGRRHDDGRGGYELRELRNRNPKFGPHNRPNLAYPVWVEVDAPDADAHLRVHLEPGPGREEVLPLNSRGEGSVWRWGRPRLRAAIAEGEVVARRRRDGGLNVYEKHRKTTTKPRSVWDEPALRSEQGTRRVRELLGDAPFDHPKPVELVARCLAIGMGPDGLVLDPFAGSGTTADAVFFANAADGGRRRSLSLQLPEPVATTTAAARAGYRTVADVTRARIAAACPDDAGLRVFAVDDAAGPRFRDVSGGDPAAYLAALDAHEQALAGVPVDAWDLALFAGARLDAPMRPLSPHAHAVATAEGELVVLTASRVGQAELEPLPLPAGTHVVAPAVALDDAAAATLVGRGCVLHLR